MSSDFENAMLDLIEKMGLEMPKSLGNPPQKRIYLDYLKKRGYLEEDVAPIIDKNKIPAETHGQLMVAFIQAMKSEDKKTIAMVVDMMSQFMLEKNTNHLVSRLSYTLKSELEEAGVLLPDFFVGVYPTNCINAQCVLESDLPLVLIDAGCMEMIEASMTTFVSKRNETEQAKLLIKFLEDYYMKGVCPNSLLADHPSINWGERVVSYLTTAVEEFVMMHEIAHLALGHFKENRLQNLPQKNGEDLPIQKRSHLQEYQADTWALLHLISRARIKDDEDTALDLTCSGALIFLAMGLMIEGLSESRNIPIRDTHPPIENRIYLAEITLEVLRVEKHGSIARKFRRLVREFCVLENVVKKDPPMLSRELNQIAVQVYESLNIEYKHMPYLVSFI